MYRLWALPPLQTQLVRRGEAVLEVWARPAQGVRQAVVRVTLRRDGKAFVQGRAGLGCCEPGIGRRIAFDAELAPETVTALRAAVESPLWEAPRFVEAQEADGTAGSVCVDGVSWDLTLATAGRTRHLRRACLDEETGQVAPALSAALTVALGREPRFDVLFPRGADFAEQARRYEQLLARGGALKPAQHDRPQPKEAPVLEEAPAGSSPPAAP